ncbi:MAG: hypothetical protein WBD31_01020 [Rubripirellula sp.]
MKKLLIFGLVLVGGCNTFRTTAIDRCDNDCLVVNPNRPMKGIPVSLRIPSHLELNVIETTYWEKKDIVGSKPTLVPIHTCRPTRTVEHKLCYTEKIFLVDPAKPCAGTQAYGFAFQSKDSDDASKAGKGYLKNVTYKVDDQTIKESANLLASSLSLINAFSVNANQGMPNEGSLVSTDRTVAYTRLDINSPAFENEVEQFLELNVNQQRSCTACPEVCKPNMCELQAF